MKLVNDRLAVKAKMLTPNNSGYILLAAEVNRIKPFGPPSPAQRQLLADAKTRLLDLAQRPDILEATLFRAVLIAPGEGTPRPLCYSDPDPNHQHRIRAETSRGSGIRSIIVGCAPECFLQYGTGCL